MAPSQLSSPVSCNCVFKCFVCTFSTSKLSDIRSHFLRAHNLNPGVKLDGTKSIALLKGPRRQRRKKANPTSDGFQSLKVNPQVGTPVRGSGTRSVRRQLDIKTELIDNDASETKEAGSSQDLGSFKIPGHGARPSHTRTERAGSLRRSVTPRSPPSKGSESAVLKSSTDVSNSCPGSLSKTRRKRYNVKRRDRDGELAKLQCSRCSYVSHKGSGLRLHLIQVHRRSALNGKKLRFNSVQRSRGTRKRQPQNQGRKIATSIILNSLSNRLPRNRVGRPKKKRLEHETFLPGDTFLDPLSSLIAQNPTEPLKCEHCPFTTFIGVMLRIHTLIRHEEVPPRKKRAYRKREKQTLEVPKKSEESRQQPPQKQDAPTVKMIGFKIKSSAFVVGHRVKTYKLQMKKTESFPCRECPFKGTDDSALARHYGTFHQLPLVRLSSCSPGEGVSPKREKSEELAVLNKKPSLSPKVTWSPEADLKTPEVNVPGTSQDNRGSKTPDSESRRSLLPAVVLTRCEVPEKVSPQRKIITRNRAMSEPLQENRGKLPIVLLTPCNLIAKSEDLEKGKPKHHKRPAKCSSGAVPTNPHVQLSSGVRNVRQPKSTLKNKRRSSVPALYTCNTCSRHYRHKCSLWRHFRQNHINKKCSGKKKLHRCRLCGIFAHGSSKLKNHMKKIHSRQRRPAVPTAKKVTPAVKALPVIRAVPGVRTKQAKPPVRTVPAVRTPPEPVLTIRTAPALRTNSASQTPSAAPKSSVAQQLPLYQYRCNTCRLYFKSQGEVVSHLQSVHPEQISYSEVKPSEAGPLPLLENTCLNIPPPPPPPSDLVPPVTIKTEVVEPPFSSQPAPPKKRFKCSICAERFSELHEASEHMKTAHQLQKSYTCRFCDFSFTTVEKLRSHIAENHKRPQANSYMSSEMSLQLSPTTTVQSRSPKHPEVKTEENSSVTEPSFKRTNKIYKKFVSLRSRRARKRLNKAPAVKEKRHRCCHCPFTSDWKKAVISHTKFRH